MHSLKSHSDQELLSLLRDGDEGAFTELYNRYARPVRALAFAKVNDRESAREIVQEIFCSIWERRRELNIHAFSAYLSTAVKYKVINLIKNQITHDKHHHLFRAFVNISENETIRAVQFNNLAEALEESVQRLPEKTQLVFRLNRMEGKSVSEIAVKMNLSEKAIKYHLSRSLKELRLYLKDFLLSVAYLALLSMPWLIG